ncbi:sugar ABC transporter substrate-binding protein [Microbacterium paludicola]|uniref:Sugar ABC transporter substrate-binding protein n=1 Tax=Microbacterium paludicola TaxID=300019 RepID=A0A4Y9FRZ6_9MICO|nr:sugar ABC transporter substrate-binding protein [Microbacterium paludicola]MBF0817285.1 sugar ABC transporter substrate-binding protein [Microbacterium paludicola]TFU31991.1 sugar ABC transporter substrate-binding protein [Microbacterium paludicola]
MQFTRSRGLRVGAVLAGSIALTSCSASETPAASDDSYSFAVLLASSENGYNQAFAEGIQKYADTLDADIDITVLNGGFNSDEQLAQLETAGTGDTYDGILLMPNDGVSIAAGFPLANGIPVVVGLNPVGPDISEMEPQVEGVISTIAQDPAVGATKQAEAAAEYCADIDPCKVALVVGQLNTALDVSREDAFKEVLGQYDNIQIVGTYEGLYDPDTSASAISNVLQAHPDLNVVLSNADQQTEGAQIALEDAGIDPADVFLVGGGGTQTAIEKTREGIWGFEYINFPVSQGEKAMEQLWKHLQGEEVETWIDTDTIGEIPSYVTTEDLSEYPDYTGEWVG